MPTDKRHPGFHSHDDDHAHSAPVDGQRLRVARVRKGWSVAKLAQVAGVSASSVRNAEKGHLLRWTTAGALAAAVGLDIADLLPGRSWRQPSPAADDPFQQHLVSFEVLIERAQTFVGRAGVLEKFEQFLSQAATKPGYFGIEGEPGSGKSALLAHLVRERGYLHHFNSDLQGVNQPAHFLGNLCARLIIQHRLEYASLPEGALHRGQVLNRLLREAANTRSPSAGPLVVLVDALDEVDMAAMSPAANVLFLPRILPANVAMVVTARRLASVPLQVSRMCLVNLDEENPGEDVQTYLRRRVQEEPLARWLRRHQVSPERFVAELASHSEGNMLVAHRLTQEICEGRYHDQTFADLPYGLSAYYRGHIERLRHAAGSDFETVDAPVLIALANSSGGLSVADLCEQTGLPEQPVRRALRRCQSLLDCERRPQQPDRWRLYHSSFRSFVQAAFGN